MATYANEFDSFAAQAGEVILRGQLATVAADGKAYLACAAEVGANLPMVAVSETDVPLNGWGEFKHSGKVATIGLTPGQYVYVSDTPGGISQTPGHTVQIAGFAHKSTEWIIHPDWSCAVAHPSG